MSGELLDAAQAIGERLVRDAIRFDGRCTWLGDAVELVSGEWGVVHRSCDGDLYAGTSGIGLFLATLAERLDDDCFAAPAHGAVRHALAGAGEDVSLYGGRTGIAWAAAEVGRATGADELTAQAAALTVRVADRPEVAGDDLIGGRAGVALGLLDLSRRLELPQARASAFELGRAIVAAAHRDAGGLSWPLDGAGEPGLCGLGHGAAGIAHALLELRAAGGDEALASAGEAAARYERAWLSREHGNWPDLRGLDRAALGAGGAPGYPSFWCHGAAGIGLARLRAWERTGSERALADAGAALQAATLAADAIVAGGDTSLCHGIAGLAELFLYAAEVLEQPELRERGRALASEIVDAQARTGSWGSGVLGGGETPGLMLGLAGIGMVLLRASSPERTQPVGLLFGGATIR